VERPRRVVRFARLMHRRVRAFGPAFGGFSPTWLPRTVVLPDDASSLSPGAAASSPDDSLAITLAYPDHVTKVLITGMSGTGKSTALQVLGERGYSVVETDTDEWSHWVTLPDGSTDWVWREDTVTELLASHRQGALFVAGCKSNQGRFYAQFDHVALLSAPADVLLARIAERNNNPYGKQPEERELILQHLATIEPRLRATATIEIDASAPLLQVVARLEELIPGSCRPDARP
jgi:broad-specificity NMP kinase